MSNQSIYNELYKLTDKYKEDSMDSSLIRRYVIKANNNSKQEGSITDPSILLSNVLYVFDEHKPTFKEYCRVSALFSYESNRKRFLRKNTKISLLPLGILNKNDTHILHALADYEINNNKDDNTQLSAPYGFNRVFGRKYSLKEFCDITDIMIYVYANKSNDTPYTERLNPEDVNITVVSSNFFEIDFSEADKSSIEYIFMIDKIGKECENDETIDICGTKILYDDKYIKSKYNNVYGSLAYTLSDSDKTGSEISFTDNYLLTTSFARNNMLIELSYENGKTYMLTPDKYDMDLSKITSTERKFKLKYLNNIFNNVTSIKLLALSDVNMENDFDSLEDYGIDFTGDITNVKDLANYYPDYLRYKFENQTDSFEYVFNAISEDKLYIESGKKYIVLQIPAKHSSVMIFQDGKIIEPSRYIYDKGINTVYIDISNISYTITNGIYQFNNIRIVGTVTYFNEDVRYPLRMIVYKFKENSTGSYAFIHNKVTSEYGAVFFSYVDSYITKNPDWERYDVSNRYDYYINDNHTDTSNAVILGLLVPDNGDGFVVYSSNEYVIPVNKSLDKKNFMIVYDEPIENYDVKRDSGRIYRAATNGYWYIAYKGSFNKDKAICTLYPESKVTLDENGIPSLDDYKFFNINGCYTFDEVYYRHSKLITNINYREDYATTGKVIEPSDIERYIRDSAALRKFDKIMIIKIVDGEILDCGFPNTDEWNKLIDLKSNFDFDGPDGKPNTSDDIPYDAINFNDFSVSMIPDGNIYAYNVSNGYSKYYINDEKDNFLAYPVPSQIMHSDGKILAFLDGKFTDEFMINTVLYRRLFEGSPILAFTDDTTDMLSSKYIESNNGEYMRVENDDVKIYVSDPNGNYVYATKNCTISGTDRKTIKFGIKPIYNYVDVSNCSFDNAYDSDNNIYGIYTSNIDDTIYAAKVTGNLVSSVPKYSQKPSYYYTQITDPDYDGVRYSKYVSSVFLTNPGTFTMYQDTNGIEYKDGIFTIKNEIDGSIIDEHRIYDDYYMLPVSSKYMMIFVNGIYIDPDHLQILSNRRFTIKNASELFGSDTAINEVFIYSYDYIDPEIYNGAYYDESDSHMYDTLKIYHMKDPLWDNEISNSKILSNNKVIIDDCKDILTGFDPKDTGFHGDVTNLGLYEIFGKYVLNNYDLDSDFVLQNEVRSYFSRIFDADDRMRFELNLNDVDRKYRYGAIPYGEEEKNK